MNMPPGVRPECPLIFDLPSPVEAPHECLPHAAMALGTPPNSTRYVSRLVIEKTGAMWTLYRLDADGGFVGDTTHASLADALHQGRREFGIRLPAKRAKSVRRQGSRQ